MLASGRVDVFLGSAVVLCLGVLLLLYIARVGLSRSSMLSPKQWLACPTLSRALPGSTTHRTSSAALYVMIAVSLLPTAACELGVVENRVCALPGESDFIDDKSGGDSGIDLCDCKRLCDDDASCVSFSYSRTHPSIGPAYGVSTMPSGKLCRLCKSDPCTSPLRSTAQETGEAGTGPPERYRGEVR